MRRHVFLSLLLLASLLLASQADAADILVIGPEDQAAEMTRWADPLGISAEWLHPDAILSEELLAGSTALALLVPGGAKPRMLTEAEGVALHEFLRGGGRAYLEYTALPEQSFPGWSMMGEAARNGFARPVVEVDNLLRSGLERGMLLQDLDSWFLPIDSPSGVTPLLGYGNWVGDHRVDHDVVEAPIAIAVTIDLEREQLIRRVTQASGGLTKGYIADRVTLSVSTDGSTFERLGEVLAQDFRDDFFAVFDVDDAPARYVRLVAQKEKKSPTTDFLVVNGIQVIDTEGSNVSEGASYTVQRDNRPARAFEGGNLTDGGPPRSWEEDRTHLYPAPTLSGIGRRTGDALVEAAIGDGSLLVAAAPFSAMRLLGSQPECHWEALHWGVMDHLGGGEGAAANRPEIDECPVKARGVVYLDINENNVRDEGEPGIPGVPVSDGRRVVLTDQEGRWELPVEGDAELFVIKPSGYALPTNDRGTPQFYYVHRPGGSPPFEFSGVPPTGPIPGSIDFPLRPAEESPRFRVVLFADPQPQFPSQLDYTLRTAVSEIRNSVSTDFGMTLGDIVGDNLDLLDGYTAGTALTGIPFHGVVGNHDLNFDSLGNRYATETYIHHFGPTTYSFNVGRVHFVAMNNIIYQGGGATQYREGFTSGNLDWLRENMRHVPGDHLVVIATHAPIIRSNGRTAAGAEELFAILEDRHRILAVAGHEHIGYNRRLGPNDGWNGEGEFHLMIIPTVSGAWWGGPRDIEGIPFALQRDGTPHGYTLVDFDGDRYLPRYKAIGKPADHQMRIHPPMPHGGDEEGAFRLIVNIFDGVIGGSDVAMRVNGGPWREMHHAPQPAPSVLHVYPDLADRAPDSHHIWEARIEEAELPGGANLIEVDYRDILGREIRNSLIFLVE